MSHSIRHLPVVGYGKSEKKDKVAFHRKLRRIINYALHTHPEAEVQPMSNEITNTRRWRKAPRGWCADTCKLIPKLLRK